MHVQVVDNNGESSQTIYSQSSASESVLSNNKERKDEERLSVVEITKVRGSFSIVLRLVVSLS